MFDIYLHLQSYKYKRATLRSIQQNQALSQVREGREIKVLYFVFIFLLLVVKK
jgi:hypothetical protein